MTPTNAPVEIYLGKGGQTHGPYTVEQFEALRASAEFASYTYVWDGRDADPQWKPIERAPAPPARRPGPGAPPPDAAEASPAQDSSSSAASAEAAEPSARARTRGGSDQPTYRPEPARGAEQAPARPVLKGYDVPGLEAVCHDRRSVLPGRLMGVTDSGCELVSSLRLPEPVFGSESRVVINLFDPESGQSMNVPARLSGVRRREGQWSYRVQWQGCPELVLRQLEKRA